jgi:hypothetical protein
VRDALGDELEMVVSIINSSYYKKISFIFLYTNLLKLKFKNLLGKNLIDSYC